MAFGNELKSNHAELQAPGNSSPPITSVRTGIRYILVLDPVVEFDETKVSQADIAAIMSKYGFAERP
jgi:hypothetical protein